MSRPGVKKPSQIHKKKLEELIETETDVLKKGRTDSKFAFGEFLRGEVLQYNKYKMKEGDKQVLLSAQL